MTTQHATGAAGAAGGMHIRRFEPGDAEAVASLWQYWFRDKTRTPERGLTELVRSIYVENPNRDPEIGPLVAEGDDGSMLGFLGITTTPVSVDGRAATLAGLFPSVVDPKAPTTAATFLLRRFLTGPQAITISDGGHVKFERIWETLGGEIAHLQSLRWVKLLRPFALGSSVLARRRGGAAVRPLLAPLALGSDVLARRAAPARLRAVGSSWRAEPLTPETLIEAIASIHARSRLRPEYTAEYLAWLFAELAKSREQGTFTATLVRDERGTVAGWYAVYLRPDDVCRVFALDAHPRRLDGVVDHLFAEADAAGAGALIGRMEPKLRRPMAARGCLVHNGGSLMMVHSGDPSLMQAAQLGKLAFSRLDAENWYWWRIVSRVIT